MCKEISGIQSLISDAIWFEAGEEFELIDTRVMKHDGREWYKVKSKWFNNPMAGFHNPDNFKVKEDD